MPIVFQVYKKPSMANAQLVAAMVMITPNAVTTAHCIEILTPRIGLVAFWNKHG